MLVHLLCLLFAISTHLVVMGRVMKLNPEKKSLSDSKLYPSLRFAAKRNDATVKDCNMVTNEFEDYENLSDSELMELFQQIVYCYKKGSMIKVIVIFARE